MPLAIEYLAADRLIPFAQNARLHSPEQIDLIADSIRQFGWTNPVLIDEKNGIIAGHGRVLAAEKLEIDKIPTITIPGLNDAEKRALVILDNQSGLRATWDESLLKSELEAIRGAGLDLAVIGFEPADLAQLLDGGIPSVDLDAPIGEDAGDDAPKHECPKCGHRW
jgi:ParB family transcriptional regulator, chromosome partitioning protein